MEHYLWLLNHHDDRGLWSACLASLLLHVLMFAVMATTSIFYPQTGDSSKIDIVWLYPSLLLGGETEPVVSEPAPVSVEKRPDTPVEREHPQKVVDVQKPEPVKVASTPEISPPVKQSPPPVQDEPETEPEPVVTAPDTVEPETEPEMALPPEPLPKPAKAEVTPPVPEKKAITPPQPAAPAVASPAKVVPKQAAQQPEPQTDKSAVQSAAKEVPAPMPASSKPVPAAMEKAATKVPDRKESPRETVAASKAPDTTPPVKTEPPQVTAKVPSPPVQPAQPGTSPGTKETGPPAVVAQRKSEPGPLVKAAHEEKSPVQTPVKPSVKKGIFLPPVTGDLKLDITARPQDCNRIKIVVLFREYPKVRHNRPMSRGEARQVQTIQPTIARQSENSLAALIETAHEGVYEFRNATESADPGEAAFRLKIYENSPRARAKSVGNRKISDKGSIVKVLMPEGIVWDDDTAFSGSMEDSESITKFNSDTGLVWKEYR